MKSALHFVTTFLTSGLVLVATASGQEDITPGASPMASVPQSSAPLPELISLRLWILTLNELPDAATDESNPLLSDGLLGGKTVLGRGDDIPAIFRRLQHGQVLGKLQKYQVTTVTGHRAEILVSLRKPTIQGISVSNRGRTNSIAYQEVGTMLRLTPEKRPQQMIEIQLELESSELVPDQDVAIAAPADADPTYAGKVPVLNVNTLVRVASGDAILVTSAPTEAGSETGSQLVILSATIVQSSP